MKFNRKRHSSGFTFLEIMLVVVIIGILAATVGVNLAKRTEKARNNAAKTQIGNFETALQLFESECGRYPTSTEGLGALRSKPSDIPEDMYEGPYLSKPVPKDPWGHDYVYKSPGDHNNEYDIFSMGRNGVEGDVDDIKNWSDEEEKI